MELKNYMEELVFMKIDEILEMQGLCNCERCRLDIAAIALNILPPRYYVTDLGGVYSKAKSFTTQSETDVVTAVLKGIELVSKKPRHDLTTV